MGISYEVFNDSSSLSEKYNPNDWGKILDFTDKHTSGFYKNSVTIHLDNGADKIMNTIFSNCMKFYHSKKLNNFIKENSY